MKEKKNKISFKLLTTLLIFAMLISSFGVSFYLHKCKTTGKSTISLITVDHCEHENISVHSCPSTTKPEVTDNNVDGKQLKSDCCSFDEESYSLSDFNFIDRTQHYIITSDAYSSFKDFLASSKLSDKLENYYHTFENQIVKPTQNFITFVMRIYTSTREDSNSAS